MKEALRNHCVNCNIGISSTFFTRITRLLLQVISDPRESVISSIQKVVTERIKNNLEYSTE